MAGVNLNEENACILATNSELVGTLIQSCKEEPFLFVGALQKRILDIGKDPLMTLTSGLLVPETVISGNGLGWSSLNSEAYIDFMSAIERSILF